jgi:hypothetical protein
MTRHATMRRRRMPTRPVSAALETWRALAFGTPFEADPRIEVYLRRAARRLWTLLAASPPAPSDAAILRALELKQSGTGRLVTTYRHEIQDAHDQGLALLVAHYVDDGQALTNARYLTMRQFGVSESTVKRAWRRWGAFVTRLLLDSEEVIKSRPL